MKAYFEDLYNTDTQEEVAVHICGFDGIRRGNYFGGVPIGRPEVELRVGMAKSRMERPQVRMRSQEK